MAEATKPSKPYTLLLLLVVFSAALLLPLPSPAAAEVERKNESAPKQWATGKDEGELLAEVESGAGGRGGGLAVEDEGDEFAGGFASLDSMLQWAIGHSDPEKLKERAADMQKLSADELLKKQLEIKELMEKMKMPSDADLMKISIADLNNASISLEDRQRALQELLVLVEPIDNANDLDKLGGLVPVIQELNNANEGIRTTSAWVLGKASQNNAVVQNQILGYGALARLVKMGYSNSAEEAVKALYAISALIRNNEHGQALFHLENGNAMLQHILTSTSIDIRLQKKAVFLVADLADFQLTNLVSSRAPFLSDRFFLKSVVDLTSRSNLDLQEKVLLAIRSLLQLTSTDARDFKKFCGLDNALDKLRVQLEELASQDEQREYAGEVESRRREVENIFHQKLEQVTATAT